jgi:histidine triad (HIT) family protein
MSDCIFCELVAGRSPVSAFYEDDDVLGLMTIGPVTTGHAMVIPKRHAAQDVFHVHLHVFPRYRGDPFRLAADWSIKPPREELDRVAAQIRAAYERLGRG